MAPSIIFDTPIQKLRGFDTQSNQLFMKRDDLLPFSFGGNKVRIAKAYLDDMRASGKNALIMYGDRHSNLCRVLANLCHVYQVPCAMVVTSVTDDGISFNQTITSQFDVKLMPCEKGAIAKAVDDAFAYFQAQGLSPYYIFGNRYGEGNEGTGAIAYAAAYQEIRTWENQNQPFDLLALPYGTGASMGGLIAGSLATGDQRDIVGISISSRTRERASRILRGAVSGYFTKVGKPLPSDDVLDAAINLQCGYNLGGYGIYDESVTAVSDRMLQENGIPMDPIYSAKAFSGLLRYLADQGITGKRILFLHTGGLPLYFDYLTEKRSAC